MRDERVHSLQFTVDSQIFGHPKNVLTEQFY